VELVLEYNIPEGNRNCKSRTIYVLLSVPFWHLFIIPPAGAESCGYLLGPFSALYPVNWIPFSWTHRLQHDLLPILLFGVPSLYLLPTTIFNFPPFLDFVSCDEMSVSFWCLFRRVVEGGKRLFRKGTGEV
jgi:hypothetical protein